MHKYAPTMIKLRKQKKSTYHLEEKDAMYDSFKNFERIPAM